MGIGGAALHGAGQALLGAQARLADAATQVARGPDAAGSEVERVVEMRGAESQVRTAVTAVRAVDETLGTLIDALG